MENGVKTVCAKNQCVGCMACFDMCPKSAITIVDTRQAYNAVIDEEKCIHCGICTNVCQNNKETTLKHPETWYQGWIEDEKLRRKSSSGGAAKAISRQFISEGGVVVSCCFKNGVFGFECAASFVLISPEELRLPGYVRKDVLDKKNIPYTEVERLEDALPDLDILYMTRVQKERFFNEEDYIRMKDFYILDKEKMELAPKDMLVLHPLPRVNEISVEVDDDPRAVYFKQVQYGVYIRMALILTLLDIHVD